MSSIFYYLSSHKSRKLIYHNLVQPGRQTSAHQSFPLAPSLCNHALTNQSHICTTFNLCPLLPRLQAPAKVTLPSHKQSAIPPVLLPLTSILSLSPFSPLDSCSVCLQPFLFPINVYKRLYPFHIYSKAGSLLILGHMSHWKISDCQVFMGRYSQ